MDSAEETALHSDQTMDSKKAPASEPLKAKEKVPETVTKTAGCLARQMALGSALHSASTKGQM